MFINALAIAGLVGYAHAQSAQFTNYAATTAALASTSDGSIATTSLAYELQEAIMGDSSTTLFV
jgi:hypothetical protein